MYYKNLFVIGFFNCIDKCIDNLVLIIVILHECLRLAMLNKFMYHWSEENCWKFASNISLFNMISNLLTHLQVYLHVHIYWQYSPFMYNYMYTSIFNYILVIHSDIIFFKNTFQYFKNCLNTSESQYRHQANKNKTQKPHKTNTLVLTDKDFQSSLTFKEQSFLLHFSHHNENINTTHVFVLTLWNCKTVNFSNIW